MFRDFPLGNHPKAKPAAEAALCAHAQGKFWEFHDKIMANQRALEEDHFKQYAAELELDMDAFTTCFGSGQYRKDVMDDIRTGQKAGVTGTPAFFVNGRFLSGAQPFEKFQVMIDEELAR